MRTQAISLAMGGLLLGLPVTAQTTTSFDQAAVAQGEAEVEPEATSPSFGDPSSGWRFQAAPYLWYNGILDSKVTFRLANIADFSPRVDDLNDGYKASLGARIEGTDGRWGAFLDLNAASSHLFYQAAATRRFLDRGRDGHLEGYFGVRGYSLDFETEILTGGTPGTPLTRYFTDENLAFLDLVVGAKGRLALGDRFGFYGGADIGGAGLLGGSDFTYRLDAGFDWQMSDSSTLSLGWSQIRMDNEDESDAGVVKYEATFGGPVLQARFQF